MLCISHYLEALLHLHKMKEDLKNLHHVQTPKVLFSILTMEKEKKGRIKCINFWSLQHPLYKHDSNYVLPKQ
jgi:hypothetical protein